VSVIAWAQASYELRFQGAPGMRSLIEQRLREDLAPICGRATEAQRRASQGLPRQFEPERGLLNQV